MRFYSYNPRTHRGSSHGLLTESAVDATKFTVNAGLIWPLKLAFYFWYYAFKCVYLIYKYLILGIVALVRVVYQAIYDWRTTPQHRRDVAQRAEVRAAKQRLKDAHRVNLLKGERPSDKEGVSVPRDGAWPL
jgi:hypothetical protein